MTRQSSGLTLPGTDTSRVLGASDSASYGWWQVVNFQLLGGCFNVSNRVILRKQSKPVYTSPSSTYDTFLGSLGQDLSNPAFKGLIYGVILTPHQ